MKNMKAVINDLREVQNLIEEGENEKAIEELDFIIQELGLGE